MALSPSAAWRQAFLRADADRVILVEIYDGTNTWKAVSRSMGSGSDLAKTAVAVEDVSVFGVDLDPLKRTIQFGELYVSMTDAWIRPLIENYRLKGQRVNISVADASNDETDFLSLAANAQIEEIRPDANAGTVTLILRSQLQIAYATKLEPSPYLNTHPLEILYDGAGGGILERAGVHSFVAATFDPTDAAYDDIDHLLVSRASTRYAKVGISGGGVYQDVRVQDAGFSEEETGLSLAQQICALMNGHLVETEDGDVAFRRFDSSASADDNWSDDDFIPGTFEQDPLGENVVNQLVFQFGDEKEFTFNESVSQAAYKFPGETKRVLSQKFQMPWLKSKLYLWTNCDAADATLYLGGGENHCLSGNQAGLAIDADHPVYIYLDSTLDQTSPGGIEIIKATSLTRDTTHQGYVIAQNGTSPDYNSQEGPYCSRVSLTNLTKAQFNTTTPVSHTRIDTVAHDITAIVLLKEELFARFKNGCPVVRVSTDLRKMEYQIGDLVTLTTDRYIDYGKDGLTTSDKWEIIGKEVNLFASPPTIGWKLAHAYTDSPTVTGTITPYFGLQTARGWKALQQYSNNIYLESGGTITQVAGLQGKVAAWRAVYDEKVTLARGELTHTFTASKDTYVVISFNDEIGGLVFIERALAAGTPDLPPGMAVLGMVTTGAAAITSIDQTMVASTANDLDDIADGSTYGRVILSGLVSGQVDTGAIYPEAVTTAKVEPYAIGTYQTKADSLMRNHNFDFGMWTRG